MSRIDGIIFDCDGVLFESRQANLAYYNCILNEFSYPPVLPEEKQRAHLCHTASSQQVLSVLVEQDDLQPALAFSATLDYRQFIPLMRPEPYLLEMLQQISARLPLAVATNRGNSVAAILAHFDLQKYFSAVVTCRDVKHPKPAPDMLLLAAAKLGMPTENCLFVGDSELDQQAAVEAKIRFAGYGGLVSGELSLQSHLQLVDYFGSA
jgi:HAD superfamily hydrolase (TIGR01509 family)